MAKLENELVEALSVVGEMLGQLSVMQAWQARAITDIATAIKADPAVSGATKEKIDNALKHVDNTIALLEEVVGKNAKGALRTVLGDDDE